jgi:hypothetical protein
MALPPQPRAFDSDDAALEEAVRAKGGLAFIAFKSPSSPRASEAQGRRAAIPAAVVREALDMLRRSGAEVRNFYGWPALAYVRLAPGLATTLRHNPLVDFVEPALDLVTEPEQHPQLGPVSAHLTGPNAVQTSTQNQPIPWNISLVGAPMAWPLSTGVSSKVMVLGYAMGVSDADLPSIPGSNCGGYFGACSGIFADVTLMLGVMLARDNSFGIVGVAPGVQGANIYIWDAYYLGSDGRYYQDANLVIAGINAAADYGIRTVVMDVVHTDYIQAEAATIASVSFSVTLVSSVGISGVYFASIYPASYPYVIGVSGVKPDGSFAGANACPAIWSTGSNYGPMVTLAAPVSGVSTSGNGAYYDLWQLGYCNAKVSAAHVGAIAALVWDRHPTWIASQVSQALRETASGNGSRISDQLGYGIPSAAAAVSYSAISVTVRGPTLITQKGTYTWTANGTPAYDYAYQWRLTDGSGSTFNLGTSSTQRRTVFVGDAPFDLTVTITYGGINGYGAWTASDTRHVGTCWSADCLN